MTTIDPPDGKCVAPRQRSTCVCSFAPGFNLLSFRGGGSGDPESGKSEAQKHCPENKTRRTRIITKSKPIVKKKDLATTAPSGVRWQCPLCAYSLRNDSKQWRNNKSRHLKVHKAKNQLPDKPAVDKVKLWSCSSCTYVIYADAKQPASLKAQHLRSKMCPASKNFQGNASKPALKGRAGSCPVKTPASAPPQSGSKRRRGNPTDGGGNRKNVDTLRNDLNPCSRSKAKDPPAKSHSSTETQAQAQTKSNIFYTCKVCDLSLIHI